jgi:hypothetical protein
MRRLALASLLFALFVSPAFAQSGTEQDPVQRMQASQAAAQAAAVRPGDEELTCDQLQAEMTTVMNDPAVRANTEQMGAWGQQQQQRMEEGRRQAMRQVGTSIVTGIVSSFIPGAGYVQQAQQMAQAQRQRAEAAQNQREIMALGANMEAILPNMYRGQRLHELGQRKQCAFAQGPGAPPQQ